MTSKPTNLSRRGFLNLAVGSAAMAALPHKLRAAENSPATLGPLALDSPKRIDELHTPALLIDLDAMERNLEAMARHAAAQGIGGEEHHVRTHRGLIGRQDEDASLVPVLFGKLLWTRA